ncbi:MAG: enoyl-CoA hydratase/isomerase family protein [Chloroflexi bacterium]|nr:enoyl-CoA hydratase/isomerase family protein [Chloroflexota bacterium]
MSGVVGGASNADPAAEVLLAVDGAVATITLNRPAALNALTIPMKERLLVAIEAAAAMPSVGAIVLTGAGRAFCVGQDLRERLEPGASPLDEELARRYNPIVRALRQAPQPVIAAINGVAAGAGASLAFACDLRIAAEGASFVLAFAAIGLVPDSGATWMLPRLVGRARAAELALLGDPLTAADAQRLGLVSLVVPAEDLAAAAAAMAARVADRSFGATAATKRLLDAAFDVDLEATLAGEAAAQAAAGAHPDHAEGIAAFMEKRPPRFSRKR